MRRLALALLFAFVFLVAFEDMVTLGSVGTAARLLGALCLLFGLAAVLETRRATLEPFHVFAFLFVGSAAASVFWSMEPDATLARSATYLQLAVASWLVVQVCRDARDSRLLLLAFVLGATVVVGSTVYSFARGLESFYGRFAAAGFNPNDAAYVASLGIPIAWYLRFHLGRAAGWLLSAYPPIAFAAVLLTASRGGLFAAAIGLAYVTRTMGMARLMVVVGLLPLAWLALSDLIPLPQESLARLATIGHELSTGTLNQRTTIWSAGLAAYASVPVLGVGAGAFANAIAPYAGAHLAPHNALVSVLVEQGALGLALFLILLTTALLAVLRLPRTDRRFWLTVGGVLAVALLLGNWEWRKQTWVLLALAVSHASVPRKVVSEHGDAGALGSRVK